MNIFVLDLNPSICAEYHNDKHCIKQLLETAQLLCGVHHMINNSNINIPYRLSHKNHPCSIWARKCMENYLWLCELGVELSKEYTFRYNKTHKSQFVIEWAVKNLPNLNKNFKISPFNLVMPDDCKTDDVVQSYRKYYCKYKKNIACWKNRTKPEWFF